MSKPARKYRNRKRQKPSSRLGLMARVLALKGWRRVVVFGVVIAVVLGVIAASGGTAYAIQLENHDAFCASCHTEPESAYYQQTVDRSMATLATFHAQKNVLCIDCHSGGGMLGRMSGLSQGAQDLLAYYSGTYHHPAIALNKLDDSSCTKCHTDTVTRGNFNNHFHLLLARWQNVDPNAAHCVDCHTSHTSGDAAQGYLSQQQVTAVCEHCHSVLAGR